MVNQGNGCFLKGMWASSMASAVERWRLYPSTHTHTHTHQPKGTTCCMDVRYTRILEQLANDTPSHGTQPIGWPHTHYENDAWSALGREQTSHPSQTFWKSPANNTQYPRNVFIFQSERGLVTDSWGRGGQWWWCYLPELSFCRVGFLLDIRVFLI